MGVWGATGRQRENEAERKTKRPCRQNLPRCCNGPRWGLAYPERKRRIPRSCERCQKGDPQFIGCKGSTNRREMRQNGAEPRGSACGGIAAQRAAKGQRRASRVSKRSAGYREIAATMNPRTKDTCRANNPPKRPFCPCIRTPIGAAWGSGGRCLSAMSLLGCGAARKASSTWAA